MKGRSCFEILDEEEEGTTSCKKKKLLIFLINLKKISMDATLVAVLLELEGILKLNKNIKMVSFYSQLALAPVRLNTAAQTH